MDQSCCLLHSSYSFQSTVLTEMNGIFNADMRYFRASGSSNTVGTAAV
jgi:hypothetical protein